MFRYRSSFNQPPVAPESLLFLAESSNQPNLAVPGHQAQAAQAFVFALPSSPGRCALFVHLWLTEEKQAAVFMPEEASFPRESLAHWSEEALLFCESMGFIMDSIPLEGGAEGMEAIFARLPFVRGGVAPAPLPLGQERKSDDATAGAPLPTLTAEQRQQLGKLLASF